jgi:hypothetical protein
MPDTVVVEGEVHCFAVSQLSLRACSFGPFCALPSPLSAVSGPFARFLPLRPQFRSLLRASLPFVRSFGPFLRASLLDLVKAMVRGINILG